MIQEPGSISEELNNISRIRRFCQELDFVEIPEISHKDIMEIY